MLHTTLLEVPHMNLSTCPVATLQGYLWSNLCSKFHENRGILQPVSRNHDRGVFCTWNIMKPPKRGIFGQLILSFLEICQLSIVFNESVIVQYTMILESLFCYKIEQNKRKTVFEIVQKDKLSLYYELVNIYKYGEKSSFKHFSFLKNRGLLKGFDFFSWFRKNGCFKELKKIDFITKRGTFPKQLLEKGSCFTF